MRWGGRQEGRSGWGTHVNPWLIHVNVWQKPLQYCKVISLQLIKINEDKTNKQTKKKLKGEKTSYPNNWFITDGVPSPHIQVFMALCNIQWDKTFVVFFMSNLKINLSWYYLTLVIVYMSPKRSPCKYLKRKHSLLKLTNILEVILFNCLILETLKMRTREVDDFFKDTKFKHK